MNFRALGDEWFLLLLLAAVPFPLAKVSYGMFLAIS